MRKVFLDVGTQDGLASLEALKQEHNFQQVYAFEKDEIKVEFSCLDMLDISSLNTAWVIANLLPTDRVFMRIGQIGVAITELLQTAALKRCNHILIDTDFPNVLQPFCRENDITLHTMERLADGRTRQEAYAHWFRICANHSRSLSWLLPSLAENFRWISATYGFGDRCADVLHSLSTNLSRRRGRVLVSNHLCGCDPCPGVGKQLVIKCMVNNVERTVVTWESFSLFVTDKPTTVVSFMVRCRNEEKTLLRALSTLEHLLDFGVGYEVVVILHKCTDRSQEIADDYARTAPVRVRVVEYDLDVSRAGLETFVTDDSHECSLISFNNWCLAQTWAPFVWKWDSDFELNPDVAEEVATVLTHQEYDNTPLTVQIPTRFVDGTEAACEPWLSSAITNYTKYIFWEVPQFLPGSRLITLNHWFLHNDTPRANPKSYWDSQPWFASHSSGLGYVFKKRFAALKNLTSDCVPDDMARCCSSRISSSFYDQIKHLSMNDVDRLWAEITVVVTACKRPHLLRRTLESFVKMNTAPIKECIIIEDSGLTGINDFAVDLCPFPVKLIYNEKNIGQVRSIDRAYDLVRTEFLAHLEDDMVFVKEGFFEKSVPLLFTDPKVFCVWLRNGDDGVFHTIEPFDYGGYKRLVRDWRCGNEQWCGFTWNSCLRLTRTARKHGPYNAIGWGEHDCNTKFAESGHYALILNDQYVRHIGWDAHCVQEWK